MAKRKFPQALARTERRNDMGQVRPMTSVGLPSGRGTKPGLPRAMSGGGTRTGGP